MRVLVATNELQGRHTGDYAFTVEGELVTPEVTECANASACGCSRGFPGLASSRATTTAIIADLEHLSEGDLREVIADWLERSGWADLFISGGHDDDDADDMFAELVDEHVDNIKDICSTFPVGTIVERSGTLIRARALPFAA